MDIMTQVQSVVDMLRNEPHVQSIELDDRTTAVHIKVERIPPEDKKKG